MAKPKTLDEAFETIEDELLKIFLKKHHDYGKDNILTIEELGITIRLQEKISRLKNLLTKVIEPANEPIDETINDIAVYAIILRLYRKKWFQELEVKK